MKKNYLFLISLSIVFLLALSFVTAIRLPIPLCFDSDHGSNYDTFGTASTRDQTAVDYCLDSETLIEQTCSIHGILSQIVDCDSVLPGTVCELGECVTPVPACIDSDGFNPNTYGYVTYDGVIYEDECQFGGVYESFCTNDQVDFEPVVCAYGCSNGACLQCQPETCSSLGYECGTVSDGCGGTLTCGSCGLGETCNTGSCVDSGVSECSGNTCRLYEGDGQVLEFNELGCEFDIAIHNETCVYHSPENTTCYPWYDIYGQPGLAQLGVSYGPGSFTWFTGYLGAGDDATHSLYPCSYDITIDVDQVYATHQLLNQPISGRSGPGWVEFDYSLI